MVEDPVADFLTRLQNAHGAKELVVKAPYSNLLEAISAVLEETGYISSFTVVGDDESGHKQLVVDLAYTDDGTPHISHTRRISKPSRRRYVKVSDIPDIRAGRGDVVLSTPQGVLSGDKARQQHVGGEVLFEIW